MAMDYRTGQTALKGYEAARSGSSHMEYNSPTGWGTGREQGPGTEVWDVQPEAPTSGSYYQDWLSTLSPEDRSGYTSGMNAHYDKATRNSRLAFLAAAGGMAALGALPAEAALTGGSAAAAPVAEAAGATAFPVSSTTPIFGDIGLSGTGPTAIASGWGGAAGGAEAAGAIDSANQMASYFSGLGGADGSLADSGVTNMTGWGGTGTNNGTLLSKLGGWRGVGSLVNTVGQVGGALAGSRRLAELGKGTPAQQTANSQLDALLKDPSSITTMPGYEAGLQAVQRTGAAQGYLGSGNMMIGLDKYGGDFYNQTVRQLAGIGQSNAGVNAEYTIGGLQLFGQGMNSLGGYLTKFGKDLPSLFSALGIGD